jgi:hypothetical protein
MKVEFQKIESPKVPEGPDVEDLMRALRSNPGEWFAIKGAPGLEQFQEILAALRSRVGDREGITIESKWPEGRGMPQVRLCAGVRPRSN